MEDFFKQIYKKPEWQTGKKESGTLEQVRHSEKIAKEKLEKILTPGFREFGIRYMNIEEYRSLVETGRLAGEFTLFKESTRDEYDFAKFTKSFETGFDTYHNLRMTDWEEISGLASLKTMDLVTSIKSIREEHKDKNELEKYSAIRKFLLDYINSGQSRSFPSNYANDYSRLNSPNANWELKPTIKKSAEIGDSIENLQIIKSFQEEENFLLGKNNLRKLLIALGAIYDIDERQSRQYHLALIVDSKLLVGGYNSWNQDHWKELSESETEKMDSKDKNAGILGVISIYPLKEMYNEIVELEKNSGDLAHPVFDHKGNIRWPRK